MFVVNKAKQIVCQCHHMKHGSVLLQVLKKRGGCSYINANH